MLRCVPASPGRFAPFSGDAGFGIKWVRSLRPDARQFTVRRSSSSKPGGGGRGARVEAERNAHGRTLAPDSAFGARISARTGISSRPRGIVGVGPGNPRGRTGAETRRFRARGVRNPEDAQLAAPMSPGPVKWPRLRRGDGNGTEPSQPQTPGARGRESAPVPGNGVCDTGV